MESVLPLCYGELSLKPWEIERLCPGEVMAMLDGWQRRYDRLEDLFINWITYPTLCVHDLKRRPELKDLYRHRKRRDEEKQKDEIVESIYQDFGI